MRYSFFMFLSKCARNSRVRFSSFMLLSDTCLFAVWELYTGQIAFKKLQYGEHPAL
jgi:hypothetical protein